MPVQNPFTEAEVQRAQEMLRLGYGLSRIAIELGRHKRTVQYQLSKKVMTKAERDRRAAKRNEARRALNEARGVLPKPYRSNDGVGTAGNVGSSKPTADMLAERDRRASRPFTIAHDILGDPTPGRSALDQREMA